MTAHGPQAGVIIGYYTLLAREPLVTGKGFEAMASGRDLRYVDVYKPHTQEEVAKLVAPEVAALLDRDRRYGIWWFNRERWRRTKISEPSLRVRAESTARG